MNKKPTLKTAMTPFPYSIELNTSLKNVKKMMLDHNIHHIPVIYNNSIIGVITARDIEVAKRLESESDSDNNLRVQDIYITKPYIVDINNSIESVLLNMATHHIGCAIVTKHEKLVGIFTFVDVCRYFGEYIQNKFPDLSDDDAA